MAKSWKRSMSLSAASPDRTRGPARRFSRTCRAPNCRRCSSALFPTCQESGRCWPHVRRPDTPNRPRLYKCRFRRQRFLDEEELVKNATSTAELAEHAKKCNHENTKSTLAFLVSSGF